MNDFKNFLIAYFSTAPSLFAAIETRTLITVISATADLVLHRRQNDRRRLADLPRQASRRAEIGHFF
jgi:adenylate kinase